MIKTFQSKIILKLSLVLAVFVMCISWNETAAQKKKTSATKKQEQPKPNTRKQQIIDACNQLDQAFVKKDYEQLLTLLSDDLQITHTNGMVEQKPEIIENLRNDILQYASMATTVFNNVEFGGDGAVVTRECKVTGTLHGEAFKESFKTKEIWVFRNNQWQLMKKENTSIK